MIRVDVLKQWNCLQKVMSLFKVHLISSSFDDLHRLLFIEIEQVAWLHRHGSRPLLVQFIDFGLSEVFHVVLCHRVIVRDQFLGHTLEPEWILGALLGSLTPDELIVRDFNLGLSDLRLNLLFEVDHLSELVTIIASAYHDGQHVLLVNVLLLGLLDFYCAAHNDKKVIDHVTLSEDDLTRRQISHNLRLGKQLPCTLLSVLHEEA